MRNPWGNGDAGSTREGTLPSREVVSPEGKEGSGGHIRMTKKEFYKNLEAYHLPKE